MALVKRRRADSASGGIVARDVALLPPVLAQSVVRYALSDRFLPSNEHPEAKLSETFLSLATVSRAWYVTLDEIASEAALRSSTLAVEHPTRRLVVELRRRLTLRRAWTRTIEVAVLPRSGLPCGVSGWSTLLSHAPRLERLHYEGGDARCPGSNRVGELVEALALHCPNLKSLELPAYIPPPSAAERDVLLNDNYMQTFLQTLSDALRVWHAQGGLRHLNVPLRVGGDSRCIKSSADYLNAVARYCPSIQTLDGYVSSIQSFVSLSAGEQWMVDTETWQTFCSTCTQLTEFDWICVPFATRFFEIFGAISKPQLRTLQIATPTNWVWENYFDEVNAATKTELEASGYGASATRVGVILKACPGLETVDVDLQFPILERRFENTKFMNPEIFGDDFCEALARECRHLTRVSITPGRAGHLRRGHILTSLSDSALCALATLPRLHTVRLVAASITGHGLYALVVNHRAESRRTHKYELFCGEASSFPSDIRDTEGFYGALYGFLERLAEQEGELEIASRGVMLRFVNLTGSDLEEGWSVAYCKKLNDVVEKVKAKHPTLRLRVIAQGYRTKHNSFQRVLKFSLETHPTERNEWTTEDDDTARDTPVDGVFVNRMYPYGDPLDTSGDDEDSEDDSDDEEDDDYWGGSYWRRRVDYWTDTSDDD